MPNDELELGEIEPLGGMLLDRLVAAPLLALLHRRVSPPGVSRSVAPNPVARVSSATISDVDVIVVSNVTVPVLSG